MATAWRARAPAGDWGEYEGRMRQVGRMRGLKVRGSCDVTSLNGPGDEQ